MKALFTKTTSVSSDGSGVMVLSDLSTSANSANSAKPAERRDQSSTKPATSRDTVSEADQLSHCYRQYSRYVASTAFRLLGSDSELEDVVQDVFLRATRGLRELREPIAIRAWLKTVTVRVIARRFRRKSLIRLFGLGETVEQRMEAREASAETQVLLRQLYRAMEYVPAKERIAWSLRAIEGESLEEVAALCDCSLATAKRRIASAQLTIEKRLGHE